MDSVLTTYTYFVLLFRLLLYVSEMEIEIFSRSMELRCLSLILGFYCNLFHQIDKKQMGKICRAMKTKMADNNKRE